MYAIERRGRGDPRKNPHEPAIGRVSKLRGDRAKLDPDRCLKCSIRYRIKQRSTSRTVSRVPRVLYCGHVMCNVCIEKAIVEKLPVTCPLCGKQGPNMDTKLDNFPLSFHTLGRRIFNSSDEDDAASLASFSTITTTTPADTSSEAESSKDDNSSLENTVENCPKHMLPILGECLQCSYDAVLCSDCLQPGGRHHNHFTNMDEQKLKQKKVAKSKATMEDRKALIAKLLQDKAAKEIEMTRFFDQVHGKLRRAELENMKKLDLIYDNLKLQMDESEEPTVEIKYPKTYIVKLENDEHFQELKFCKNGVEETVATMVNGSPNSTKRLPLSPPASPPLVEELDFDLEPTKMKRVTLKKSTSEESGVCDDQIRIVHVENPSTFWVQRFKDVGKITAMEKLLQQKHKAGVLTTIEPDDLKKGLRCVVQRRGIHFERNDGQWLRVQILLVDANTVHVEHLDQGIKAKYDLKKTEFYYGPKEVFAFGGEYPIFAVRCELYNVVPRDWTPDAEVEVDWSDAATGLMLHLYEIPRTMFAQVMQQTEDYTVVEIWTKKLNDHYKTYISKYLVFYGEAKYKDLENAPKSPIQEKYDYKELGDVLGEGRTYQGTLLSTDPSLEELFIRFEVEVRQMPLPGIPFANFIGKLEELLNEMDNYYAENSKNGEVMVDVPRKMQPVAVLVRNRDDTRERFFRGQVVDDRLLSNGTKEVLVNFVDEGKDEWIKPKQLRTLPCRFMETPKLAVKCVLHGINPKVRPLDLKAFFDMCNAQELMVQVERKMDRCLFQVALYQEFQYKILNINSWMVWQNMAELKEPSSPFYQRVEYPREDPMDLLNEQGHSYLPIFTNAKMEALDDGFECCRLQNCIRMEDGTLIVFLTMINESEDLDMIKMHDDMVNLFEAPNFREENADLVKGELVVARYQGKYHRGRIWEAQDEEITVVGLDTGQLMTIERTEENTSKIWPLYANFTHCVNRVSVHKLYGTQATDSEACKTLKKLCEKSRLFVKVRHAAFIQPENGLAKIDLTNFSAAPEADLAAQVDGTSRAFGELVSYHFNIGRRLEELGVAKGPKTKHRNEIRKIKLAWPEHDLPKEEDYLRMRTICPDSSVTDYKAKISCNDEYGGFALSGEAADGSRISVSSRIEPWFNNSRPKFHDYDWYVGEPCIAQFYHDNGWYRGIITQIPEGCHAFMVKFVDYGNEAPCYRNQLRKDLVAMDTPVLTMDVELSNVELNKNYNSVEVYNKLCNLDVDVELTEFPQKMPMKCKLNFALKGAEKDDIGSYLVRLGMAKYITAKKKD